MGIEVVRRLEALIEFWEARLRRHKLSRLVLVALTEGEVLALAARQEVPVNSSVAADQVDCFDSEDVEEADCAEIALRELLAACHSN